MISPFSPPEVGAAVVCFCVSYEGPMFPRSFNDGRETKVILHMRTYTVVWTTHLTCWWPAWRSIPDPAGQTLGIPPRDLCCPGQGVLWRGTHLALYSGTKGKSTKLSRQITWIHSMSAEQQSLLLVQKSIPDWLFQHSEQQFWSLQRMDSFLSSTQNVTIVFTMLLGHVSFPGRWRVVMHSQYLSMKGMISCGVAKNRR